jgi:hypothetical protein
MTGKMNWDRVGKEELVRRHGSAWTPSVLELDRWKSAKKTRKKRSLANGRSIFPVPGCQDARAP